MLLGDPSHMGRIESHGLDLPPAGSRYMRDKLKIGLVAVLCIQVLFILYPESLRPDRVRLSVGMEMPYTVTSLATMRPSVYAGKSRSCRVAFVCTTDCPYCSELASHVAEGEAGHGALTGTFYIGNEDMGAVRRWASDHDLEPSLVAQVTPRRQGLFRSVYGHVWGTPFRVIYDTNGEIRDARPSRDMPTLEDGERLCDLGGIAPQNITEFEQIFGDSVPRVSRPSD